MLLSLHKQTQHKQKQHIHSPLKKSTKSNNLHLAFFKSTQWGEQTIWQPMLVTQLPPCFNAPHRTEQTNLLCPQTSSWAIVPLPRDMVNGVASFG